VFAFGAGACLLGSWAWWELHVPAPLTDLRLLRRRGIWSVDVSALFASGGLWVVYLLVPAVVQAPVASGYGLGASPSIASLYLVPLAVGHVAGATVTRALSRVLGTKRTMLASLLVGVAAFGLFALSVERHSTFLFVLATAATGLSIGCSATATVTLLAVSAPQRQTGEANGVLAMLRNVGSTSGATVAAVIMSATAVQGVGAATETGLAVVIALGGLLLTASFAAGLLVPTGAAVRSASPELAPSGPGLPQLSSNGPAG
jgi:MFS family permease